MGNPQFLLEYRRKIDAALEKHLSKELEKLGHYGSNIIALEQSLVKEACLSAGKRLRPTLTLISYGAAGGKKEGKVLNAALAFELFHAYTLVHDDIYDEDMIRRKKPTLHAALSSWFEKNNPSIKERTRLYGDKAIRFGIVGGVLGGEILHNLCLGTILEAPISDGQKMAGLKIYASAAPGDNICQLLDLAYETEEMTEDKYLELARLKSGKLLRSAAEWGVVLANGTESQRKSVGRYAELLGQAFQIKDDLLDIGVGGKKGRPLGSDLRSKKKTLLILYALQKSRGPLRKEILKKIEEAPSSKRAITRLIELLYETGSVDYSEKIARKTVQKALEELDKAKPKLNKDYKDLLVETASYMFSRAV